jgi:hypothetical protein
MMLMDVQSKLATLADAARHDAWCASHDAQLARSGRLPLLERELRRPIQDLVPCAS